jgi:hypothetical protein
VDEAEQALDGFLLAFEDRLDAAVPAVRHPAGDAVLFGAATDGITEEHPLDSAVHDDAATDHGRILARWSSATS